MAIYSFEELQVYQKAYAVSLEVHRRSLEMPSVEQYELASQMRKASKSICANLAEGYGKSKASPAEFKRYIQVSLGSAEEMVVWIQYCFDLGYITFEQKEEWLSRYQEIARMLQGLYKSWR